MARMNCGQTVFSDHFDLFSLNLKLSDIEKKTQQSGQIRMPGFLRFDTRRCILPYKADSALDSGIFILLLIVWNGFLFFVWFLVRWRTGQSQRSSP